MKIAPAATDSPMEPTVRAIFSSRIDPLNTLSSAIPITAAGYVAAIVMPAFKPRYAFAAPRMTDMTSPISTARIVNSFISVCEETYGTYFFPSPVFISAMRFSFYFLSLIKVLCIFAYHFLLSDSKDRFKDISRHLRILFQTAN